MAQNFVLAAVALVALTSLTTIGCSNEEIASPTNPNTAGNDSVQTPASSADENGNGTGSGVAGQPIEALRDTSGNSGLNAGPSLRCNSLAPIQASTTRIRVRVSDEVAPTLEQADAIPDGSYVFDHADYFTDRPRDNFTMPASTLVIGPRSFEEVSSNNTTAVRTLGTIESRAGGKVHLECVDPAPSSDEPADFASFSKDANELTLQREFEGGLVRRVFRRQ